MREALPDAAGGIPQDLLDEIAASRAVVALTGAGMSAESGIPTFRGPGGLWRSYRPEDLATPDAFRRDPVLVWEWYDWRRQKVAGALPNAGHRALAALEAHVAHVAVVTQNVDGLHLRAGSRCVIELHGNIMRARCVRDGRVVRDLPVPLAVVPPRCACGALLRPDVLWFGEALEEHITDETLREVQAAEVVLVVGTSSVVYPAAAIPVLARKAGATVVEVNPEPTPLSALARHTFRAKAGEFLPRLVAALEERHEKR